MGAYMYQDSYLLFSNQLQTLQNSDNYLSGGAHFTGAPNENIKANLLKNILFAESPNHLMALKGKFV